MYPFYTGYPFANGVGAAGGLALAGMSNPNPFFASGCNGLLLGSSFAGQPTNLSGLGATGQFALGANVNVLNFASPGLSSLSQFGTLGAQNVFGCTALR
jgi:hypothetical protein